MTKHKNSLLLLIITIFITFAVLTISLSQYLFNNNTQDELYNKTNAETINPQNILSASNSHPNYWSYDTFYATAKLYKNIDTPQKYMLVSSQPYNSHRLISYKILNGSLKPKSLHEQEEWNRIGTKAIVYRFGNKDINKAKYVYPNITECQKYQPGITWPDIDTNKTFAYTPFSYRDNGTCTDHWQNVNSPGSYIAIKGDYRLWGEPWSSLRITQCNDFFFKDFITNHICKSAPRIWTVTQRYAWLHANNFYSYGCEYTIYVGGYKDTLAPNIFRNGELLWSNYITLKSNVQQIYKPDDIWWNKYCSLNKLQKEKIPIWIYTGKYLLNNFIYNESLCSVEVAKNKLKDGLYDLHVYITANASKPSTKVEGYISINKAAPSYSLGKISKTTIYCPKGYCKQDEYYYKIAECTTNQQGVCSIDTHIKVPASNIYYVHCNIPDNQIKCSGNPHCDYKGGFEDKACKNWHPCSLSNSDYKIVHVE